MNVFSKISIGCLMFFLCMVNAINIKAQNHQGFKIAIDLPGDRTPYSNIDLTSDIDNQTETNQESNEGASSQSSEDIDPCEEGFDNSIDFLYDVSETVGSFIPGTGKENRLKEAVESGKSVLQSIPKCYKSRVGVTERCGSNFNSGFATRPNRIQ
ncbi:hypothetical protein [Lewinella sp. LCG006]|uniref:hypothetical protein n=1 Tax=Lewinella sp. LCG006 TaxID=3231911 RepID=UPI00345F4DAF